MKTAVIALGTTLAFSLIGNIVLVQSSMRHDHQLIEVQEQRDKAIAGWERSNTEWKKALQLIRVANNC